MNSPSTPAPETTTVRTGVVLRTFGGAPEPGLAEDLLSLRALPNPAKAALWELIGPNLGQVLGDSAQAAAERFCARYSVPLEKAIPLVRGCRLLFRRAAQKDLAVEAVHQDLLDLSQDREVSRRLAACYSKALPLVRTEAVLTSMHRFGPELLDIGLRIDHIASSRHTPQNMVPIAVLSLRYRDGNEQRSVNLQVAPPMLKRLKLMLDGVVK